MLTWTGPSCGVGAPSFQIAFHRTAMPIQLYRTPYERIRAAALEGFARDGVAATSIRDVAAAAGVSPGLVQHYFPSKAALRSAVDEHVTEAARTALELRKVEGDVIEDLAERLTGLVADHFVALRYVARGVAESDEAA